MVATAATSSDFTDTQSGKRLKYGALLASAKAAQAAIGYRAEGKRIEGLRLLGSGTYAEAYRITTGRGPFEGKVLKVTSDQDDAKVLSAVQKRQADTGVPLDRPLRWPESKPTRGLVRVHAGFTSWLGTTPTRGPGRWFFVTDFAPPLEGGHRYVSAPSAVRDLLRDKWSPNAVRDVLLAEDLAVVAGPDDQERVIADRDEVMARLTARLALMANAEEEVLPYLQQHYEEIDDEAKAKAIAEEIVGDGDPRDTDYIGIMILGACLAGVPNLYGAACDLFWADFNLRDLGATFFDWHSGNIGVIHKSGVGPGEPRDALVVIDMGHQSGSKLPLPELPRAQNPKLAAWRRRSLTQNRGRPW